MLWLNTRYFALPIGLFTVCASTGDEFISYFIPNDANISQIREMTIAMNDANKERIKNLSVEDNPVLVSFNFD